MPATTLVLRRFHSGKVISAHTEAHLPGKNAAASVGLSRLPSRPRVRRPRLPARRDPRRIRSGTNELLLWLLPIVCSSASRRVGHASMPDSRLHAAHGVWDLLEDAEAEEPRTDSGRPLSLISSSRRRSGGAIRKDEHGTEGSQTAGRRWAGPFSGEPRFLLVQARALQE
jgi:hypothetical protein